MRIIANTAVCVGSGQCVFTDPDTFDQDDDGTVLLLRAVPENAQQVELARLAVQLCPSRALSLTDD